MLGLSSLPCLRHLTLRLCIKFCTGIDYAPDECSLSCIPAAVRVYQNASQLNRLTIDICVDVSLSKIDFSPLVDLARSSASFDQIDLYIRRQDFSYIDAVSELAKYKGVEELIERGRLVLHVQEVAPLDSRFIMVRDGKV